MKYHRKALSKKILNTKKEKDLYPESLTAHGYKFS